MKLPRRVPWASLAELDELCSWIYTNANDIEAKVFAMRRLSAWKAITQLPHALEATLSLLVAIHQDNTAQTSFSYLSLRQCYATAIIRLVNGLVDPLQLGAYARSIASIASQLGLPLWLVELRHAATHEHLPSLETLRDGAREAMTWLLHNYFLPTLNPSTIQTGQEKSLRPLSPLLKQYKSVMKIVMKDASLRGQYKAVLTALLRDCGRWLAEAKVVASEDAPDVFWEASMAFILEMDAKEKWALEQLCDCLMERGSLVPLSKKKRIGSSDGFSPPSNSVLLWVPLLEHIQVLHPPFLTVLVHHILFTLLTPNEGGHDRSYCSCLARWAYWILQQLEEQDLEHGEAIKSDTIIMLMQALGHSDQPRSGRDTEAAFALLDHLCKDLGQLDDTVEGLKSLSLIGSSSQNWTPDDVDVMSKRLEILESSFSTPRLSPTPESRLIGLADTTRRDPMATDDEELPQGWRLLGSQERNECPIGVWQ